MGLLKDFIELGFYLTATVFLVAVLLEEWKDRRRK